MVLINQFKCTKCGRTQSAPRMLDRCMICRGSLSSPVSIGEVDIPESIFDFDPSIPSLTGPSLWLELHNYRWIDLPTFQKWFEGWLAKVDRLPNCGCSKDFRTIILPKFRFDDIATDKQWFVRSWQVHNAVNQKLGKSQFPVEQAYALFR